MNQKDKIPALVFLAIGLGGLLTIIRLPFGSLHEPDTAFFPILITLLIIVLSLALFIRSLRAKAGEPVHLWRDRWHRLIPVAASLVVYAFLLKAVGYVGCTLAILILIARLEKCSWKATMLVSFLCTFISYSVFTWYLKSPLPRGILPF